MNSFKNTRKLVTMGLFAAVSVVLVTIIHFPLFPAAGFLEYDPADIPILICTFAWGPLSGFVLTVVVSLLQGFTVSSASGIIGIVMHIFATGSYCLVSGSIYKKHKSKKSAVVALICGTLTMTVSMIIWNLLVTPHFMGCSVGVVVSILPWIALFNIIKASVNGIISYLVYKPISLHIKK